MNALEIDFEMFPERRWTTFSIAALRPEFLRQALAQEYQYAQIGRSVRRHRNAAIRSDVTSWIEFDENNHAVSVFFEQLMNILNQETYFGLTNFEAHFSCYQPGAFYDWHKDVSSVPTASPRRISFVAYLHEAWSPEFAGELEFADGTLIHPKPGVAVLFDSEKILHRVRESHFTRRSLTAWFRTGSAS